MNKYEDIIHFNRPVSFHPSMQRKKRAAQFAPFAALNGHAEAIEQSAYVKEERILLSEDQKKEINSVLRKIQKAFPLKSRVAIVYYGNKGRYCTYDGYIQRVDEVNQRIFMEDKTEIPIREIIRLKSSE